MPTSTMCSANPVLVIRGACERVIADGRKADPSAVQMWRLDEPFLLKVGL